MNTTKGLTLRQAGRAIQDGQPFKAASMSGRLIGDDGDVRLGRMPEGIYRDDLLAAVKAGMVDYVVYSYGTPIGWHHKQEGWMLPEITYSKTTARHLFVLRSAVR